ncbi:FYDLN acid domain-containing protein [Defluviimonas sp. SAOS-178_SWC]|uniref:FYDLN acid domain-containing protein n=1 Tax=Defluviimonas sp. SAOS-178_SWC TaxID=3121287 RepID=UPI003221AA6C
MPKDEWGVKRLCPHCASRFYDLQRDPMTCPECGHTFTAESLVAGRGRAMISEKTPSKDLVVDADDLTDDDDLDNDAGDDDLDDDLLEDDDDDVSLDDIADVATNEDEG